MQDDKPPVFEAHDLLGLSIAAMTGMIESATFRTDRMRALAESGFATATDLADWLVREAGVPFREAHHITGRAVKRSEEHTSELQSLMRHSYAVLCLILTSLVSPTNQTSTH